MENWRLIISPPQNGAINMAIDEGLLLSSTSASFKPTLRLFDWSPACLSLGYAQPVSDVDTAALKKSAFDLVRRPTGGRAILHIDELTYSLTAPQDLSAVRGGVLESYRRLSLALLEALQSLGVDAYADKKYGENQHQPLQPVCFEVPSNYEITANGKKLIGSAQSRKAGGVLQHGSLPLFGDISRIADFLIFENEQSRNDTKTRIHNNATTLEEVIKKRISWQEAAQAIVFGFESTLHVSFTESQLSGEEQKMVDQLVEQKYSSLDWTNK